MQDIYKVLNASFQELFQNAVQQTVILVVKRIEEKYKITIPNSCYSDLTTLFEKPLIGEPAKVAGNERCLYVFNKGKRANEACGVLTKNSSKFCTKHSKSSEEKIDLQVELQTVEEETWEDLIIYSSGSEDCGLVVDGVEDELSIEEEEDDF
jgi:hypothetical protein